MASAGASSVDHSEVTPALAYPTGLSSSSNINRPPLVTFNFLDGRTVVHSPRDRRFARYTIWVATVLGSIFALLGLIFVIRSDATQGWTAAKDFLEFCQSLAVNQTDSDCQNVKGKKLNAPPYGATRFISGRDEGNWQGSRMSHWTLETDLQGTNVIITMIRLAGVVFVSAFLTTAIRALITYLPIRRQPSSVESGLLCELGLDHHGCDGHEEIITETNRFDHIHSVNEALVLNKEYAEVPGRTTGLDSTSNVAHRRKGKRYICPVEGCSESYSKQHKLRWHQRMFHKSPIFHCLESGCGIFGYDGLHSFEGLNAHQLAHHSIVNHVRWGFSVAISPDTKEVPLSLHRLNASDKALLGSAVDRRISPNLTLDKSTQRLTEKVPQLNGEPSLGPRRRGGFSAVDWPTWRVIEAQLYEPHTISPKLPHPGGQV